MFCNIIQNRNSLAKHRTSDRQIRILEGIEGGNLLEKERIDDQLGIPNNYIPEKGGRRPRYVDNFRLSDTMRLQYTNIQTISLLDNAYARMKITGKYIIQIEQRHNNNLVKQMCNRYAKLIQPYHFKYQTTVRCEYLNYREDEPDEYAIIPSSMN